MTKTKTTKTTKSTKTTAQRVATVRKTILAEIRAMDKARRKLIDSQETLVNAIDFADENTKQQLYAIENTLLNAVSILNGALDERASRLVGTYTAR